jgi:large exoprotein involved in heme utilization and adhesion
MPEGTPFPPASSIDLAGTNLETNTRVDALGGKIELKASGPIRLENTTISSNVNNVRPQSANTQDQGGNIDVSAGTLIMHGSGISTVSSGTQNGGNIVVSGQESITLGPGSTISASNTGEANAGNLSINAGSQFLSQNASVTAQALHGSGGNITVQATDAIRLANSQINTSVQGGPNTSGGNILLDPAVVTLQNSQVLAQATEGAGGNITIIAGTFLTDPASVVSASSQFGLSGAVTIQSPLSNLSNTLATLPQRPLQAQQLLTQRCAAQGSGHLSSLVIAGRDALPVEPGGWLMSPLGSLAMDEPGLRTPAASNGAIELSQQRPVTSEQGVDQHDSSVRRGRMDRAVSCGS